MKKNKNFIKWLALLSNRITTSVFFILFFFIVLLSLFSSSVPKVWLYIILFFGGIFVGYQIAYWSIKYLQNIRDKDE